jgi:hypothetical protein
MKAGSDETYLKSMLMAWHGMAWRLIMWSDNLAPQPV